MDHPVGVPFDVFLVKWLAGDARGRHDINVEVEVVFLDKPPYFLLSGYLTGGVVDHGMRCAVRRWCPCGLQDGVIPRVSPDGAVVDAKNER